MAAKSQAELETQLQQRWQQVENGTLLPQQAFSNLDEWIIQLGKRRALLHPNLKQWMWFDRLHDYWVATGCGVGEVILLTKGNLAGIKKLPQPDAVDRWCMYQQGSALMGPVRIEHLRHWLESQQVPTDIMIWSPRSPDWLSVAQFNTLRI
jgi:hypothetical protein